MAGLGKDPNHFQSPSILHLGEAGLAASIYFVSGARRLAPEAGRQNWSARQAMDIVIKRGGRTCRCLINSG